MRVLNYSELDEVQGGVPPVVVAAIWLGRAGAVGGLISLGYYFYNRK